MRPGVALTEAWRQIGPRHAVFLTLTAVIIAAVGILTTLTGLEAVRQEIAAVRAGKGVWQVSAEEGGLDAARCEAAASLGGVEAAGGVIDDSASLSLFPDGGALPRVPVSPGAAGVWGLGDATVLAGGEMLRGQRVEVGQELYRSDGSRVVVAGAVPSTVPVPQMHGSLVEIRPPLGLVSVCWIRMAPGAEDAVTDVASHALHTAGLTVRPVAPTPPPGASPADQWHRMLGYHPGLIAGLAIAALTGAAAFADRSQWAIYRAFGARRWLVASLAMAQLVIVGIPATLGAMMLTPVVVSTLTGHPVPLGVTAAAWLQMAEALSVGIVGVWPLASLANAGGAVAHLKDR